MLKQINKKLTNSNELVLKINIESIDRKNTGLVYVSCNRTDCKYYINGHCGNEYIIIGKNGCIDYEKI